MPLPACSAPIAPILTMRPASDDMRCGIAAREALSAVMTLSAYIRCQVLGSPSATVSKAKPPAMLISASILPKCAAAASIAFLAWAGSVRSTPPSSNRSARGRYLRRRMIDAGNPGAPCQRFLCDDAAESAQRARHDNDFSVHEGPPHLGERERTVSGVLQSQCGEFLHERSVPWAQTEVAMVWTEVASHVGLRNGAELIKFAGVP